MIKESLKNYIYNEVIPGDAAFDKAHREGHALTVIERALSMGKQYDINEEMNRGSGPSLNQFTQKNHNRCPPAPDGYCGDEDNGQTSAWYVFSALGFYPVCPTSTEYALGTPLFRKATVHLPGGNLVVRAGVKRSSRAFAGDSDIIARTPYVDNFRINGRRVTRNYLRHNELTGGARLDFTLSDSPNLSRGTKTEDLPYSYSNN